MQGEALASGRPMVAVLPFVVSGDNADARRLGEAIHEEICGELTRFRGLRVIAPASAARLAEMPDDQMARDLSISHILRGRIRRDGQRLQLSASLSSVKTHTQVWSDRFEFASDDVIEMEDKVVARIAASLNVKLEEGALSDARRRPVSSLAAYDLTLQGLSLIRKGTRESSDAAQVLISQALELDPLYARGHSALSLCWFNQWNCHFWDRFEEASQKAYLHARRALELDDSDAMAHLTVAQVALFRCAWEQAAWYLDRALMLCPNDADLLTHAAILEVFLGRAGSAGVHLKHAMQINPYHSADYFAFAAVAAIFDGDLQRGVDLWSRCDAIPLIDIPAFAAAAHAHLGHADLGRVEFARYVDGYREKIASGGDFEPDAPVKLSYPPKIGQ